MAFTESFLAMAIFAFVSSITPGPNNLMLMASGTNFGFFRSTPHMLGVAVGFALMLLVVGAGLGASLNAFPPAMLALKYASVVYMLYLAWRTAIAAPPRPDERSASARPLSFAQAAAFQWVNPKAWTMSLTAMSVYVPTGNRTADIGLVALVFAMINLPAIAIWTTAGVQLRRLLHRRLALRIFNVSAAVLLIGSLYPVLMGSARPG